MIRIGACSRDCWQVFYYLCRISVVRITHALVHVAVALMDEPAAKHWGYDLSKRAGVRSGVLYPMLTRMLQDRWLDDGWEDPAAIQGRPPRRYYELTDRGRQELGAVLHTARSDARFASLRLGLA
jgi:PadR family transcriptional regulator PadR